MAVVQPHAVDAVETPSTVWVASGATFPDELVAGAAAGRDRCVLLLIDGADPAASPETHAWLAAHREAVEHIRIAGGTAGISADVEHALRVERPQ